MRLYELSKDLKELENIDLEETDTEQLEYIKEVIKSEIVTKGTGIIRLVRNWESDLISIKSEIDRLTELKKIKENKIKKLKEYTKMCLQEAEMKKVETKLGNMTVRKNPVSIVIDDESLIDADYKQEVVTIKIDKKAIKEDITKNGVVVNGCHLEQSTSLIIK